MPPVEPKKKSHAIGREEEVDSHTEKIKRTETIFLDENGRKYTRKVCRTGRQEGIKRGIIKHEAD